jgi:hypothetical protein
MRYQSEGKKLILTIPNRNKGKFRFKTRVGINKFGESHATCSKPFNKDVYLEWQIGYDTLPKDLHKKPTDLQRLSFVGANGKTKHPYELSELLWQCVTMGLISRGELQEAINEIALIDKLFDDEFSINISEIYEDHYNDISFLRGDIVLPSFFYRNPNSSSYVEVAIKQQQYASGAQPMVYISIPVLDFENGEESIGKKCNEIDEFIYVLDKTNASLILNAFKIFGMCSSSHKHDTLEILKLILNDISG